MTVETVLYFVELLASVKVYSISEKETCIKTPQSSERCLDLFGHFFFLNQLENKLH